MEKRASTQGVPGDGEVTPDEFQLPLWFDGSTYDPKRDRIRLGKQAAAVFTLMSDGRWRSLLDIEHETGYPQASISARLRDFRKERFGSHDI
jgi:hypothetical protein